MTQKGARINLLSTIASALDRALLALTGIIAFLLLLFSGYCLYDTFYAEKGALASADLLQYKPTASAAAESQLNGFDELLAVNEDAAAWLTVYDTHIDHPVVQGRDNYEYANTDVFGKPSLAGTLYLSADNNRHFHDNYNVIYGHHMDNGGMFGDIDEYYDEAFFREHTDGFLQTLEENYRLTIFAFMVTDAYDADVYFSNCNDPAANEQLWQHIQEDACYILEDYKGGEFSQVNKLIALSTCEDAATDGRIVLFADAIPGQGRPESDEAARQLSATRHGSNGHLALLNLVCVVLTLFILLPVSWIRTKYRQIPYAARQERSLAREHPQISVDMRRFVRNAKLGLVLEAILAVAAVVVFLLTERIGAPLVFHDEMTDIMFLILSSTYIIDFICFQYRGRRPTEQ